MSFELIGLGEAAPAVNLNNMGWAKLLHLATLYGWEPQGCIPADQEKIHSMGQFGHEDVEWLADEERVGYDFNDFQKVTSEDAAAFAAALERSLDDIPDHVATPAGAYPMPKSDPLASVQGQILEALGGGELLVAGPDPSKGPLEYFSGSDMKGLVREAITLGRAGAFMIF